MRIYTSEDLIERIVHILLIYDMLSSPLDLVSLAVPEVDHMNENRLRAESDHEIVRLDVSIDVAEVVDDF